jgi:hypothetical membrane protein
MLKQIYRKLPPELSKRWSSRLRKFALQRYTLAGVSGFLLILLYCAFTLTSWAFYPDLFTPWTNYLSRLGNINYNPLGAYFYNLGCILTGIVLIPFFLSLRKWYTSNRVAKCVIAIGQIIGICAALALISIGVFSEDQGTPHLTASSTFFILNFVVLLLISIGLMFHSRFIKAIGIYGLIMTILSLPLEFLLGGPLVEWYTVFGSLIFVGLLSYNTMIMNSRG